MPENNHEQIVDSDGMLAFEDPESRTTDWVEQEPTRLERVYPWWRPRPDKPGGNGEALAALRALVEQHGERLTVIEQAIPGLGYNVITFNTRWGHIIFNAADLLSVDGATRTWVLNQIDAIPGIGNIIDAGTY